MPWTWVRPLDGSLLQARPLIDVGCGDAQTLLSLAPGGIGLDRSLTVLRAARRGGAARLAAADAVALPVLSGSVAVVMAGDLVHHLSKTALELVLAECRRVLRPDGALVAWWWSAGGHPSPDAPTFPRSYAEVARLCGAFVSVAPLQLETTAAAGPPTVGVVARA